MIGRTINRYKIVEKIGEGGMGTVWKAEDPLLDRTIALKFLPESLSASASARKRLLREARAASALNHSGIATVYDAGEADDRVYIAMLFVDGDTVASRIAQGPLPISEATRIAREACEALGHAHVGGVLHRDVTSRNIMTAADGHVVIVDFGLALPEGASRLTRSGVAVGTTAYLAPEVLRGEKSDQRSDIYGLGVVLYEMLTGKLPFLAERQEALSYLAVHEDAKAPSAHSDEIDTELDRIVLKAMAKDPEERFQSAQEFEAALRVFRGEPPRVDTDEALQAAVLRQRRKKKLRPLSWVILGVTILAVAGVLWRTGTFPFGGSQGLKSIAVLPLLNYSEFASESDWLAEGISERLATQLTQLPGLKIIPWRTSSRFSDPSRPLQEIARELHADALVTGSVRRVGDRIQITISLVEAKSGMQSWADDFEEPVGDLFAAQGRIAVGVAASLKGKLSGAEEKQLKAPAAASVAAYEYYMKGSLEMQASTREANNRALTLFEKAVQTDPALSEAYVGIGAIHSDRFGNGWEGGAKSLDSAEANFRRALELDPSSANARAGLTHVYWARGMSEECLKQGQAVSQDPDDIEGLFARGQAYHLAGQSDRAIPLFKRIIALDPANLGAHWFLCWAQTFAGHHEDALATGEEFFVKFGEDATIHMLAGDSYHAVGDLEAALIHCERSLHLATESESSYYDWYLSMHLGTLYGQTGEEAKAREIFARQVRRLEESLAAYPDNFRVEAMLAATYGFLGDKEMLQRTETRILDRSDVSEELFNVAIAYAHLGESNRAFELLKIASGTGADNLSHLMNVLWDDALREAPGYEDCVKVLEKLNNRLRSQY
ncbi:MAG: protein kinase [Candidatus Krumholzibacteria bacterium]